jgi:hypothetical protein
MNQKIESICCRSYVAGVISSTVWMPSQKREHYSEGQCARLVKQMLSAVRSIAQRDLKLEFFCV